MNGLILINKPSGITSFDVVFKLRKIFETKKIGHSGTLDPLATGVLPVFVNRATKAISYLEDSNKKYVAKFLLGKRTNTLDITGEVLEERESFVRKDELDLVLKNYVGQISQIPPMFSAVKQNGVALHKLARQGMVVPRKARKISIFSLKCTYFDEASQIGELEIFCSSGTYVRVLCSDVGDNLKVGGVLLELKRTMACGFELENCLTLEEVLKLKQAGELSKNLIKIEDLFKNFEKIWLDEVSERKFLNGLSFKVGGNLKRRDLVLVYGVAGFLGLGKFSGGFLKLEKLFLERSVNQ